MLVDAVRLADRELGPGHPCFVVGEIGINHNGSLETAKQLIDMAADCGVDAVKFQKRTVDVVYTADELARPRSSPFGTTNGDLKRRLELGAAEYDEIDRHCRRRHVLWYASCWDDASVDFLERYAPPCHKVASPCLTNDDLLRKVKETGRPVVLSTGMSTVAEIDHAVSVLGGAELILLHCTSTYPTSDQELNLDVMQALQARYRVPVGYSGHEIGVLGSSLAACLGAVMVERHITLDRQMWGSDQAASLEPHELQELVGNIRKIPRMRGDGQKVVYDSERPILEKLRRSRS